MAIEYVDVRATRFAASLTLLTALAAIAWQAWWVAAAAAGVLLAAAWGGRSWNLWGYAFRGTLVHLLAAPTADQREPDRAPRFSNLLGGLFLVAASAAWLGGAPIIASILAALVAGLAFLNAAFGYCLGCHLYGLLIQDTRFVRYLGLQ